jgi:hypothetical protein
MTPISSSDVASWLFDIVDSPLFINSQNSLYDKKVQIPNSTCISISGISPSIIFYYKNGVDFSGIGERVHGGRLSWVGEVAKWLRCRYDKAIKKLKY